LETPAFNGHKFSFKDVHQSGSNRKKRNSFNYKVDKTVSPGHGLLLKRTTIYDGEMPNILAINPEAVQSTIEETTAHDY
jgi:hypothetical protein